jgi:ribosomal protein L17
MNGGLIGFGIGFIAASLALHKIVSDYLPQYASTWQFRGGGYSRWSRFGFRYRL